MAGVFHRATRVLEVFLDGPLVGQGILAATSSGTALPVQIGRSGALTGKYFTGRIDDIRIWKVARSATEIGAGYRSELNVAVADLVAKLALR